MKQDALNRAIRHALLTDPRYATPLPKPAPATRPAPGLLARARALFKRAA